MRPLLSRLLGMRSLFFWVIGCLCFFAVILVVLHLGSLERMVQIARGARPAWLLFALLVQVPTYFCAALVWRQALRHAGHPLSMRALVPLGVAKVFTDQVLPSGGISGTMLVVRGLIRRQVPSRVAMAAMVTGLVSYDIAYLVIVLTSVGILWINDRINLPILIGVGIFAVITIAIPTAVLSAKRWGDRKPLAWLSKLLGMTDLLRALRRAPAHLLRSPGLLIQTSGLSAPIQY